MMMCLCVRFFALLCGRPLTVEKGDYYEQVL